MKTRSSVAVVGAVVLVCGALPATPADHRDGPIFPTLGLDAGVTARLIVTAVDLHRAGQPERTDTDRRAQRLIAGFEVYAQEPRSGTAPARLRRVSVDAAEFVLAAGEGLVLEFTAPAEGAVIRPVVDAKDAGPLALPQTVELRRDGTTFAVITGMPASGHR